MKALVTGADGLLGSHLVRKLLAKDIDVRVFILPGSNSPSLDGLDIERMEGDLLGEAEAIDKAVSGCDYIFHCAAITDFWASDEITWKVNLDGTKNLLDAAIKHEIKRFVFTGSASSFQFGPLAYPTDETAPFSPEYKGVSYMESKSAAMKLVNQYVAEKGLSAVTICPTFMLGEYDWRPSSGELIRQFINRKMRLVSPGGRCFVLAADVAGAMVSGLEKGGNGEVYIAGGTNLTYIDFFTKVAEIAKVPKPIGVLPGWLVKAVGAGGSLYEKLTGNKVTINYHIARMSTMGTYYSSAKAVRELDMEQTDVEIGIEGTLRSLKEYGHIQG